MADDLTLVLGDRKVSGWASIRVTRGVERMPADFEISMTERFPGELSALVVQPGDKCQVLLGSDPVLTGYVDVFFPELEAATHKITVAGRSKSEDGVDCSAEWPGSQIVGSSALEIAQKLCKPYGVTVKVDQGVDVGPPIPQFNLTYGETAYAIIERICRYRGLLFYDQPDGSVLLAQAGNGKMASGVTEGVNVKRMGARYAWDQRYSVYEVLTNSVDTFQDTGDAGFIVETVNDTGVNRHRQLDIIAESGDVGNNIAKQRGLWEAARRAGRANVVMATVDSWRDSAGTLWTPNYKIPISGPTCKVPAYDWVISEVSHVLGPKGSFAELVCMPRQAFLPEPIVLLPFAKDVPLL